MQTFHMRTSDDFVAARELFFRHDGSRFYMSRNGLEEEYLAHRVPKNLEVKWMRQLTEQHARSLSGSYDWWALNFFLSHRDTSHVRLAVSAPPAGKLIDQIIYLEMLARYLDTAPDTAVRDAETQTALKQTIEHGKRLRPKTRSDRSQARLKSALAALASHVGGRP